MLVKLLPEQLPMVWDSVKFAVDKVGGFRPEDRQKYLIQLLISLLSSESQCFVRLDNSRQLQAIFITRISGDELTGDRSLFLDTLYSFVPVDPQEWMATVETLKTFAEKEKCKNIIAYSANPRVFDIATSYGFVERFRSFVLDLGGR